MSDEVVDMRLETPPDGLNVYIFSPDGVLCSEDSSWVVVGPSCCHLSGRVVWPSAPAA